MKKPKQYKISNRHPRLYSRRRQSCLVYWAQTLEDEEDNILEQTHEYKSYGNRERFNLK